jgi:hypothetical protein
MRFGRLFDLCPNFAQSAVSSPFSRIERAGGRTSPLVLTKRSGTWRPCPSTAVVQQPRWSGHIHPNSPSDDGSSPPAEDQCVRGRTFSAPLRALRRICGRPGLQAGHIRSLIRLSAVRATLEFRRPGALRPGWTAHPPEPGPQAAPSTSPCKPPAPGLAAAAAGATTSADQGRA